MAGSTRRALQVVVAVMIVLGLGDDIHDLIRERPPTPDRLVFGGLDTFQRLGGWAFLPAGLDTLATLLLAVIGGALLWGMRRHPGLAPAALLVGLAVLDEIPWFIYDFTYELYFAVYWPVFTAAFLRFGASFPQRLTQADLPRRRWSPVESIERAALRPRLVWGAGTAIGLLAWITEAAPLVPPVALVLGLLITFWNISAMLLSVRFFRLNLARADQRQRSRVLWMVQASVCYLLGYLTLVVLYLGIGGWRNVPAVTLGFANAYLVLVLLVALLLTMAIFYDGAVDPALAIRKTTIFGGVGALLLFAFFAIEGAVSALALRWLGIGESRSVWIAAAAVAVAVGPARRRVERRIDSLVLRLLPSSALAEGRRDRRVVVFCDLVGYTRLAQEDEQSALTTLALLHRTARTVTPRHGGSLVKTIGDAVLLEFGDEAHAIAAAEELATSLRNASAASELPEPRLRTGIHAGLVARDHAGDIFGDVVNIAARLNQQAAPTEILLSAAVAEAPAVRLRFEPELVGDRRLRNVAEPIRCYVIGTTSSPEEFTAESAEGAE
ncbi:MAG: adenylate/guanylate cyclase domain-containing protein [Longimicrobiales bacterium]